MPDLRAIAETAARAGGAALRRHAGRVTGLRTKTASADMVSAADVDAGVAVCRAIAGTLPDARFVVEEAEVYELADVRPGSLADAEVWVIDPLDGTASFVHGYPCWSVSVACLHAGAPVAGAVFNVPADEMYSAGLGEGAALNGVRLECRGAATLDHALLGTGFPYDRGAPLSRQLRLLERMLADVHDVRRDGSAAIDLCHVAANRTDGFWETGLNVWDMAAGVLVVTEAGGAVADFAGAPWTPATRDVASANATLLGPLLAALAEADRAR